MRDRGERLLDMLEAIERIERYAAKGRTEFEKDELIQIGVVHHIPVKWRQGGEFYGVCY